LACIIDYSLVLETLLGEGLESLYHNSGAFGFPRAVPTHHVGWIGPVDPTLKASALPLTRRVGQPYDATLASLAVRVWQEHLPGRVWLMPRNHWAFELTHGNGDWMPAVLEHAGVEPAALAGRNDGAAIEFAADEGPLLRPVLEALLTRLWGSDFGLVWPGKPILCTVHHHTQLWWTTSDERWIEVLDGLVPPAPWGKD
jgi:hypothetical protein